MKIYNRYNNKLMLEIDTTDANLRRTKLRRANLYGANLRRANLYGADLYGANLSGADLYGADLYGANLRRANLYGANLYGANLSDADLSGANLYGANLRRADLSGANLYGANLSDADLSDANLSGASLSGANLSGANLYGADLSGASLPHFKICPEDGGFYAWKKTNKGVIKIYIPVKAKRVSSLTSRKCRASYIKVISGPGCGGISPTWDKDRLVYNKGTIVKAYKFDDDIRKDCTHGIHFFMTKKEAEEYGKN